VTISAEGQETDVDLAQRRWREFQWPNWNCDKGFIVSAFAAALSLSLHSLAKQIRCTCQADFLY
jgi:hypothetical protein